MKKTGSVYSAAGVDIDAKMNALKNAKKLIQSTLTAGAVKTWGGFGGLFQAPGADTLLVSSMDGVGTKLKVATMMNRHDTVGQDIVNHCVNDILVQGATPLFFLDYIGVSNMDPGMIAQILKGLARACKQNGCSLIGGETAELPGLYPPGEYDLVGTIVGAVKKRDVITGATIRPGDVLIGLPSSGCHTNGYTLARHALLEKAGLGVNDYLPGTKTTVGAALLAVHRSYLKPVTALMKTVAIRGMAHITGGGFPDNIKRVLPATVDAEVDTAAWTPPVLFRFIQQAASVEREEMYRVFNMGIGMVIAVRAADAPSALAALKKAGERPRLIGRITRGRGSVTLMY
ncbi:MAG TPA: phosphoribosylformylglycinamidine cyclo-ligase [Kiritimatiellia bacterium]|nr:phosphoribosylformylglycinamidine cyclo-ligase [Kiritimatiellia bacterium]HMO99122.1 phosphoribosylformylglycinamidine cyclo-ligase [Kiritimatiellia bacterium]HMP95700.1 phosphoribosylformylglycinamidine cyclo-ligase [Kiritimatiellia bacterium]